jgi:hypothetical protein
VSVVVTVISAVGAFAYGMLFEWRPPRGADGFLLPLYFASLLAVLTGSFVISGNTLMHHHRTGTVQRATSPLWFWCIVVVQSLIAVVLFVLGCVRFSAFYS